MLKKLLGRVGAAGAEQVSTPRYAPYAQAESNQTYDLLFCDKPEGFRPAADEQPVAWQAILFGDPPVADSILALAQDKTQESRVRALAFNWLCANGHRVPAQQLFGVVVETPLRGGLDTLAVYADGSIRHINQTGNIAVIENANPDIEFAIERLLHVAQDVVNRIGPWKKTRLPPPAKGKVRLSFVVSDGLYFGEGPEDVMRNEPQAGPVLHEAAKLRQLVVKLVTGDAPATR
jgi:hypothetical protein